MASFAHHAHQPLYSLRRACIDHVRSGLKLSEQRVCRVLGQHRSTQRRVPAGRDDVQRLTADIVELARRYGRYGYRKIAELLRSTAGWVVNDKRVERIWRCEGLKVPAKQPKRGRLWLADGSCAVFAPSGRTMSDPTTLSRIARMKERNTGC
jgi:HTH-like domain